jgi:ankyrin repeat protein
VDLEARNKQGRTVFLEACRFRDASVVGLADLFDANVNARDYDGKSCKCITLACCRTHAKEIS